MHLVFDVGYASWREDVLHTKEEHEVLEKFDRMLRDITADESTGQPAWTSAYEIKK